LVLNGHPAQTESKCAYFWRQKWVKAAPQYIFNKYTFNTAPLLWGVFPSLAMAIQSKDFSYDSRSNIDTHNALIAYCIIKALDITVTTLHYLAQEPFNLLDNMNLRKSCDYRKMFYRERNRIVYTLTENEIGHIYIGCIRNFSFSLATLVCCAAIIDNKNHDQALINAIQQTSLFSYAEWMIGADLTISCLYIFSSIFYFFWMYC
jgi:hypothetical protein